MGLMGERATTTHVGIREVFGFIGHLRVYVTGVIAANQDSIVALCKHYDSTNGTFTQTAITKAMPSSLSCHHCSSVIPCRANAEELARKHRYAHDDMDKMTLEYYACLPCELLFFTAGLTVQHVRACRTWWDSVRIYPFVGKATDLVLRHNDDVTTNRFPTILGYC